MIIELFSNDTIMKNARDKAFTSFININEKSAFFISQYADNLMKKEGMSETESNSLLEQFM
jgi:hypothetical protein